MKKFCVILIMISLLLSTSFTALADGNSANTEKAEALKDMGLFMGGGNGFDLERVPSRIEGGIMLIRLLGKETEALASNLSHPFTDVPEWASSHIGYLYKNGLANGIGNNKYGDGLLSAKSYVTFVLRALGYDDANGDFSWMNALDKGAEIGLISEEYKTSLIKKDFLRDDMVKISYDALSIKLNNSQETLIEKLIAEDVVEEEIAKKYFVDPNAIVSIEGLKVTINVECEYKLPHELKISFGDNTVHKVPVKWEMSNIDTSKKGNYDVKGELEGYDQVVTLNVDIIDYVIKGSIKDYNKKESEHFTAFYTDNEASIIDEVLNELENNFTRIVNDLKVDEVPKIELNIYPNLGEYHKTLSASYFPDGIPNWSVGNAKSEREISIVSPINTGPNNHDYESMLKVVVHEFTHSVSKLINPKIGQTRYLSEAIALYEANQFRDPSKFDYIKKKNYPSLEEISSRENTYEYDLGYVIIEYVIEQWGMDKVINLIEENGDIENILDITTQEFEEGFYKYIEDKYL